MTEFHVNLGTGTLAAAIDAEALQRIEDAIADIDPASVLDFTPTTGRLWVATALERDHLWALLAHAGCAVEAGAIVQLPSICCGGCSG